MQHRKPKTQPEQLGSRRLIAYMEARDWYISKLGGGKYNVGWPDYYAYHRTHGHRWIEMKVKDGKLRSSQIVRFRKMTDKGDKIYVLENETHYGRLFENPNWEMYIRGVL